MDIDCVLCEVRAEFLYVMQMSFILQRFNMQLRIFTTPYIYGPAETTIILYIDISILFL
jgi:hypothetical protein